MKSIQLHNRKDIKQMIKKRKRKIKYVVLVLFLLITGFIWQALMQKHEWEEFEAVGEIVSVNSHDMHAYIQGDGNVSVVFIAGSGTPCSYTDFYSLQKELIPYAKTLSFDHAGYGWSEKTDIPRTIDNLANELKELLYKTGIEDQSVLVAHSLASLEVIRFAQLYPEAVKGIVFLDSGSPEFYNTLSERQSKLLNRTSALLRVSGLNRVLGNVGIKLPVTGENIRYPLLPSNIKKIDVAMYYRYIGNTYNISSIDLINENAEVVLDGGILNNIPILVLSSDSGDSWKQVQKQLASWSENSKEITLKKSDHYIHWTNKDEVVNEIVEFISSFME